MMRAPSAANSSQPLKRPALVLYQPRPLPPQIPTKSPSAPKADPRNTTRKLNACHWSLAASPKRRVVEDLSILIVCGRFAIERRQERWQVASAAMSHSYRVPREVWPGDLDWIPGQKCMFCGL